MPGKGRTELELDRIRVKKTNMQTMLVILATQPGMTYFACSAQANAKLCKPAQQHMCRMLRRVCAWQLGQRSCSWQAIPLQYPVAMW